jgi:hypothetical protein
MLRVALKPAHNRGERRDHSHTPLEPPLAYLAARQQHLFLGALHPAFGFPSSEPSR